MLSLAEMATYFPVSGAFTQYAARFIDPSLGFAMGWIYWFSWSITYALELTAAGKIIQWWNADLSIGIFSKCLSRVIHVQSLEASSSVLSCEHLLIVYHY